MGAVLLLAGLGVLAFGLFQHVKGKRILAAPFKTTGELAKNPVSEDPKGAMSTEGRVLPPVEALLSPASKTPCLYYELKVERLFEKTETTQDGTKTVKGSETLDTITGGAVFSLDDGSGPIAVDASKGADFDSLKDGYKKELNGRSWSSQIQFGEYAYDVPAIGSDKGWTIGFKATERFVPVEGNLFVLGKLDGARLVKPGWRSMMASSKGREGLLGSIQKKKKYAFIGGGAAAVLAIPLMIFGPRADPNAAGASCPSSMTDERQLCHDTLSSKSGERYTWTVATPGQYELEVVAPAKKVSLDPQLIVTDASGEVVADVEGGTGQSAKATVDARAGVYTLVVKPGDDYMVKGGFSFDLHIKRVTANAAPVAAAPAQGDGEAAPADGAAYTDGQLAERLASLNEIAPDTFNGGEFSYTFTKLTCEAKGRCELSFSAKHNQKPNTFTSSVVVEGFDALKLADDEPYRWEGTFDESVSKALVTWEAKPMNGAPAQVTAKKSPIAAPKDVAQPKTVAGGKAPQPKAGPAPARAVPAPKRSNKNLAD